MRRRHAVLSALSAGLLFAVATGALAVTPAAADDAPSSASPSAPVATDTPTADPSDPSAGNAADPVDLGLIDIGLDDEQTARGSTHGFGMDVSGTSPGATLTLTVPAALTVISAQFHDTEVTCTPATGTVVCDLGAVDGLQLLTVNALVAATTPIGSSLHVDATLTPVPGPDLNPDDNTVGFDFGVVGSAVVTQAQSVRQVDVPLGGSAPFTVTLRNDGPDPATNVRVSFVVQSNDTPRPVLAGFTSDRVSQQNGGFVWTPGTLAVGATISLTVTVTATSPAVDSAISYASSYDGVGQICQGSPACLFGAPIRTFVPDSTGVNSGTDGPELAATGSDDAPLTVLGVALLVGGAVLVGAGRRRRAG